MPPVIDPILKDIETFRKGGRDGDDAAVKRVTKDFERIRAETEWRRRDWLEYNDLWLGHLRLPNNYPLNSRSHIPLVWSMIETMTPHYVDALYDDRGFLNGISQSPDPAKMRLAEDTGKYMNYLFVHVMKYLLKLIDTIRGSLVFGTMYQQVIMQRTSQPDFRSKADREARIEKETGEEGESAEASEKEFRGAGTIRRMFFDNPDTKVVPPHDAFPDLPFKEIGDMRFFIHRDIVSASQIIANSFNPDGSAIYKNLNDMLGTRMPADARQDDDELLQGHSTRGVTKDEDRETDREDRLMERLFYWTPTWLIIVINRQVAIFNGPTPMPFGGIPYVAFRPVRDTRFHHGIGVPQTLRSIAKTMNVILNQRLDNLNLVLNPMHKIRRDGQINTAELRAMAGGFVHMENLSDHDTILFPDVTGSAMANVNDLSRWADIATGVQEFFRGQAPSTSRTPASTVSQIINQTTRRFSLAIRGYQESILEVVRMATALVSEFGDENMIGRFLGKDGAANFVRISRTKLRGAEVDFAIMGKATSGNPDILLSKLMELELRWKEDPDVNSRALKARILDLSGLSNIEEILNPIAPGGPGQIEQENLAEELALATQGAPDTGAATEIQAPPGPEQAAPGARQVLRVPGA